MLLALFTGASRGRWSEKRNESVSRTAGVRGGEEDAGEGEVQADEPSPRSAGRIPEKYSLSDHGGGALFFFSSLTFLALCTARCYC